MSSLTDVLEDLCFRFIVNCPSEDLLSFEIELAHWFYEDHYRELDKSLPALGWKEFAKKIFNVCDLLKPYGRDLDEIFERFRLYKSKVPAYGAILLDSAMTHVVLVKGWTARSSWGFPKGKVNKDEPEIQCAQREVYEETSYDITSQATEVDYLEAAIHEQRVRLYIVRDVPHDAAFAPRTKKEISKIEWHTIDSLPSSKNSSAHKNANHYYTVIPFVSKLRHWIKQQRSADKRRVSRPPSSTSSSSSHVPLPLSLHSTSALPSMSTSSTYHPVAPHVSSETARAHAEAAIKALIRLTGDAPASRSKSITVAELFASAGAVPHPHAPHAMTAPHSTPSYAPHLTRSTLYAPTSTPHSWDNFSFDSHAIMSALQSL